MPHDPPHAPTPPPARPLTLLQEIFARYPDVPSMISDGAWKPSVISRHAFIPAKHVLIDNADLLARAIRELDPVMVGPYAILVLAKF